MHPYVSAIEHAVSTIFQGISFEEERLKELERELTRLRSYVNEMAAKRSFLDLNPDLDDEGLGTFMHWETHFSISRAGSIGEEISALQLAVDARSASVAALSGALFQIGKLGISSTFCRLDQCPTDGRQIGSQSLKAVVWAARNQSMHYEEANFNDRVKNCFEALERDFGGQYSLAPRPCPNLAFEVLKVVGWRSATDYAEDLDSILSGTPGAHP